MKVHRFRFQGFRSLRDLTLEPSSLSVLVGPNNAGKTNIVAAVELVEGFYGQNLLRPIGRLGGFQQVAFRPPDGSRTTTMTFDVELSIAASEMRQSGSVANETNGLSAVQTPHVSVVLKHRFSLAETSSFSDDEIRVESESVEIEAVDNDRTFPIVVFNRADPSRPQAWPVPPEIMDDDLWELCFGRHRTKGLLDLFFNRSAVEPRSTELLIIKLRFLLPIIDLALERLASIRVFRLAAADSRQPVPRPSGSVMEETGDRLPALIRYLQQSNPELWLSVIEAILQVIPSLEDISVDEEYGGQWTLRFHEKGRQRPWLPREISDGTLRALAALAALHDIRSPLDLIEEPENSLHPWSIRVLIDACRRVTKELTNKQVVLTTHSPILLDYVQPEDVFVVWREDGETHLAPLLRLDPDAQRLWGQGDLALSDLVDNGWLRQSIPGGVS